MFCHAAKVIMYPKLEIAFALGVTSLVLMWVIAIAPIAAQERSRVPTAEASGSKLMRLEKWEHL